MHCLSNPFHFNLGMNEHSYVFPLKFVLGMCRECRIDFSISLFSFLFDDLLSFYLYIYLFFYEVGNWFLYLFLLIVQYGREELVRSMHG